MALSFKSKNYYKKVTPTNDENTPSQNLMDVDNRLKTDLLNQQEKTTHKKKIVDLLENALKSSEINANAFSSSDLDMSKSQKELHLDDSLEEIYASFGQNNIKMCSKPSISHKKNFTMMSIPKTSSRRKLVVKANSFKRY